MWSVCYKILYHIMLPLGRHIFPHILATDDMNKCCKFGDFMISSFLLSRVCIYCMYAYIVAKPYVCTYGLATIFAHTRK